MEGMTREQLVCAALALIVALVGCSLLQFADTPRLTALCCVVVVLGVLAFWLSIGED